MNYFKQKIVYFGMHFIRWTRYGKHKCKIHKNCEIELSQRKKTENIIRYKVEMEKTEIFIVLQIAITFIFNDNVYFQN